MLDQYEVGATIPAADMQRAKKWYEEKLGLTPDEENPGGARYRCGSTWFLLYPTQFAGTAKNTVLGWDVDDVEKVAGELRGRGVVFEEYDMPGLRTQNGIADIEGERAAWFKDSEGNILSVGQRT